MSHKAAVNRYRDTSSDDVLSRSLFFDSARQSIVCEQSWKYHDIFKNSKYRNYQKYHDIFDIFDIFQKNENFE